MKKYIILHCTCTHYLFEINSKYLFTSVCYNIVIVKILNFSISKYLHFLVVKSRKINKKKIPRLLGKDVNSYASGHKSVD